MEYVKFSISLLLFFMFAILADGAKRNEKTLWQLLALLMFLFGMYFLIKA